MKRNRLLALLLLPALCFIGFCGWLLYCMGESAKPKKHVDGGVKFQVNVGDELEVYMDGQ